jgi:hypothetical protein
LRENKHDEGRNHSKEGRNHSKQNIRVFFSFKTSCFCENHIIVMLLPANVDADDRAN